MRHCRSSGPSQRSGSLPRTKLSIMRRLVIAIVTFLSGYTHASPALILPLSGTPASTGLAAEESSVKCFKATLFDSRVADTKSCLQAILRLPDNPDPGNFHNGPPIDTYKLPVVKKFGPCMTTVTIEGRQVERSSWDHIFSVANSIAQICSTGQYPMGSSGGLMYGGANKNLRITVEAFNGGTLANNGGQNGTVTS